MPDRLYLNRKIGIDLKREYALLHSIMQEIKHTLRRLSIFRYKNIRYRMNRAYDTAIRLKTIASNFMVITNINRDKNSEDNENYYFINRILFLIMAMYKILK